MKILTRVQSAAEGFSLIEVIVTLTVAGILGSMLVAFMGPAVIRSSDPIKQIRDLGVSGGKMEKLSGAYACYLSECTDNDVCSTGNSVCTWDKFKTACANYGEVDDTVKINAQTFNVIQVTTTTGSQKILSYFIE